MERSRRVLFHSSPVLWLTIPKYVITLGLGVGLGLSLDLRLRLGIRVIKASGTILAAEFSEAEETRMSYVGFQLAPLTL